MSRKITSFIEFRHPLPLTHHLPVNMAYHCFATLEVDCGKYCLCAERFDHRLELMFGEGDVMQQYVVKKRANGEDRAVSNWRPLVRQASKHVWSSVAEFIRWL